MENCYDHCACSNCYGISHFADDLVRTAPVDVSPTITELHDMCSTRVITSSQQQDDIPLTSLPYSDTATPHTSTPLTSESTGRINLQPSSTPSELDKTSEMSTPFLSHDVTSVDLTKTSLPTVPVNSGTISPSRTTCSPIKTTAINQEELEEKVQQLRSDLLVDKKKLSSWKRTLTSAADDRQSAANIGYVGVLVVCLIPLIIILMDLGRIHKGIKQFRSRVNKKRTLPPDQIT
ncbi:hypothetical protein KP79_PYT18547 [Mizuhopecten yessoensis]|uniref:Uncharacterized protein n=1 Tax=Mizuhopecten yessoensis TaxID=6573 RepID=A0A210QUH1_MIZYE|nr:hypothetical protein KP79_PYT18547 [Mizuhopecten yessoensis]